jgi:hypothetical protein
MSWHPRILRPLNPSFPEIKCLLLLHQNLLFSHPHRKQSCPSFQNPLHLVPACGVLYSSLRISYRYAPSCSSCGVGLLSFRYPWSRNPSIHRNGCRTRNSGYFSLRPTVCYCSASFPWLSVLRRHQSRLQFNDCGRPRIRHGRCIWMQQLCLPPCHQILLH